MVRKRKFIKQSFIYKSRIELLETVYVDELQVKGTERVGRSLGHT